MTKNEEQDLLKMEADNKRKKVAGWVKGKEEKAETDVPVDIVVISHDNRRLESITVWVGIRSIPRLKRLIEREKGKYGDSQVVCVESMKFIFGEFIKREQVIKINNEWCIDCSEEHKGEEICPLDIPY